MKIIQKKSHKKSIIIASLIVALLVTGGAAVYLLGRRDVQPETTSSQDNLPVNDVDYSAPSEQEKSATDERKQEIIDRNGNEPQKEPDEPSTPSQPATDLQITIVRASQGGRGYDLNIRTVIEGTSTGQCQVTLTRDGQPSVKKTFAVALDATTAQCADANIPASAFGESGEWHLSVTVTKDGRQSNPAARKVNIEK